MKKFVLTFPNVEGDIVFTYDEGEVLQGVVFNGDYPERQRRNVLRTLPVRPEVLQRINWRDGILTEEAEKVTFEMFWNRYNDKARSSKVKTQRVWDRMPEGERVKAYRYINRYKCSIPQGVCMKYATTYLNDQLWNN